MPGLRGMPPRKMATSASSQGFSLSSSVQVEILTTFKQQQSSSSSLNMLSSCFLEATSTSRRSISTSFPNTKPLQRGLNNEQAIRPHTPVTTIFRFLILSEIQLIKAFKITHLFYQVPLKAYQLTSLQLCHKQHFAHRYQNNAIPSLKFIYMRSLYTEDIQGTKSRPTIFDKGYYKRKYIEEIMRSPRNPDKTRQYEWFTPLPKVMKPEYTRQPYRNTIKLISQHTGLNNSMHYDSLKKDNNNSQTERQRNYSLLSYSGSTVLNKSKISVDEGKNPYYPHRIRQAYDQSNSTKFTGNRNWNYSPNAAFVLPDPRSQYTSKWIRI